MTELLNGGAWEEADRIAANLQPFFGMVGVATRENSPRGEVECKARNPVPVKTLMNLLGMPAGPCRRPLGKMTRGGFDTVRNAARQVQQNDPQLLAPIAEFFGVDIEARLQDDSLIDGLIYEAY